MSPGIDLLLVRTNNTPLAGFVIMSALGQKQTCAVHIAMSAKCHKRTSAKPHRLILGHCRRISEMIRNRPNLFFRRSDTKAARSETSLILRRYFGLSSTYSTDVSSGYQAFRGSTLSCVERTVSTSSTAALSEGVGG